jgi:hypothetical protein
MSWNSGLKPAIPKLESYITCCSVENSALHPVHRVCRIQGLRITVGVFTLLEVLYKPRCNMCCQSIVTIASGTRWTCVNMIWAPYVRLEFAKNWVTATVIDVSFLESNLAKTAQCPFEGVSDCRVAKDIVYLSESSNPTLVVRNMSRSWISVPWDLVPSKAYQGDMALDIKSPHLDFCHDATQAPIETRVLFSQHFLQTLFK